MMKTGGASLNLSYCTQERSQKAQSKSPPFNNFNFKIFPIEHVSFSIERRTISDRDVVLAESYWPESHGVSLLANQAHFSH